MAKIKHIAIATQDPDKTAGFYKDVFGLEEVGKVSGENAEGYYLSDGNVNIAILNFKSEVVAGEEFGTDYSGIHHIGFQVDSLQDTGARLRGIGGDEIVRREVAKDGEFRVPRAEEKWSGPNGQVLDISEPGWLHKLPMD